MAEIYVSVQRAPVVEGIGLQPLLSGFRTFGVAWIKFLLRILLKVEDEEGNVVLLRAR